MTYAAGAALNLQVSEDQVEPRLHRHRREFGTNNGPQCLQLPHRNTTQTWTGPHCRGGGIHQLPPNGKRPGSELQHHTRPAGPHEEATPRHESGGRDKRAEHSPKPNTSARAQTAAHRLAKTASVLLKSEPPAVNADRDGNRGRRDAWAYRGTGRYTTDSQARSCPPGPREQDTASTTCHRAEGGSLEQRQQQWRAAAAGHHRCAHRMPL